MQPAHAESFVERFNTPNPSWQVKSTERAARTVTHRRSADSGKEGVGEFIAIEAGGEGTTIRVEHPLPKARVLNELEASVWVRTNQPGVQMFLRVVLPDCKDPATGKLLALRIPGEITEGNDDWQRLTCRTDDKLVQEQLRLLRARLKQPISPKMMYVDRVLLTYPLAAGKNEMALDELNYGPIVKPEISEIAQTGGEQEGEAADDAPVQFRLDRLEVLGKPFFPRMVVYHGEPIKDLAAAGFNIVWVPDYSDQALLTAIRLHGMWAVATPPAAAGDEDDVTLNDAGLIPFTANTRAIAFWMLGTRISPRTQTRLVNWAEQVQEADRKYGRPLAADVSGEESVFSRELDLLGISRHTMASSLNLGEYRDWLAARRSWARPGSLCWTWIQTAPTPAISAVWEQHHIPVQLEPEQIRLQAFASLAAGMRGLGFWTNRPITEETPADRETLLAMRQLNWELWLLEPWLATTNSVARIPVTFPVDRNKKQAKPDSLMRLKRRTPAEEDALNQGLLDEAASTANLSAGERDLSAAVLRTDYGTLLLPMWLEEHAQFVPGRLGADQLSLIVPGVPQTAVAWEITTTGIHSLEREQVAGGVRLTLRNFDQTACILLTEKRELVEQIRQRIGEIEEQSARTWLTLAELKLERVRAIDQQLGECGLRQPDAPQLLGRARESYLEARAAVSQQDWSRVRQRSQHALQMARVLQRVHWNEAVRQLPSPVASPFTVGYGSLPTQARLALQMSDETTNGSPNLLPSGQFEDATSLIAVGWQHEQDAPEVVHADAELNQAAHRGKYSLRLIAAPASSGPAPGAAPLGREFVRVTTPAVTVHAGHVARISGWIKLPNDLATSPDGVMIYDSVMGRQMGLRYRKSCDWQRFELVREAVASQEMTVTMTLTSLGEVLVDDLQITVHPIGSQITQTAGEQLQRPKPAPSQNRWSDLRRLNPLSRRPAPRSTPPAP